MPKLHLCRLFTIITYTILLALTYKEKGERIKSLSLLNKQLPLIYRL